MILKLTKWISLTIALAMVVMLFLLNAPYLFAWLYMGLFVCGLIWTRKFFK